MEHQDTLHQRVQKRLNDVEREATDLEAQAAALRAKAAAYREILGLANSGSEDVNAPPGGIKPGSTVAKVIGVLEAAGKDTHLVEIVKRLGMPVTAGSKRGVSTQINAYFREGRIFTRPKPATYGLRSWGRQ